MIFPLKISAWKFIDWEIKNITYQWTMNLNDSSRWHN